jgi:transcriptional regulator with XRE-family HTH domain
MNIGERIKHQRIKLGYTQEDLAKKMGYRSKSTINKIELGINDISQSKIIKFAKVLDTDIAYLMGWEPKKTFNQIDEDGRFQPLPVINSNDEIIGLEKTTSKKERKLLKSYNQLKDSNDPKDRAAAAAIDQLLGLDEREDDDR